MRIHFPIPHPAGDPLSIAYNALTECHDAGTVARHVGFKRLTLHRGGPGYAYALEIQLDAQVRDRGRRQGNSGSYGAMGDGTYAATYDEWGFFLAALYRHDEGARAMPNFKRGTAQYLDASHFHEMTGRTYDPAYPAHVERYGDDYGYRSGRNQIGRRGAGRMHYDSTNVRWAKADERTADYLRKLQAGEVF